MEIIVEKAKGNSVEENNETIINISKKAELIIVVGQRENQDINKLYETCLRQCGNAMIIENVNELNSYSNYIRRFRTVGVLQDNMIEQEQMGEIIETLKNTQVEGYIHEHFK